MSRVSAGILGWRRRTEIEVLLVHPGGPMWVRRDDGAWTIPKGLVEPDESPEEAARRELLEETGWRVAGELRSLGTIRQRAGKIVHGFAAPMEVDPATLVSNTFRFEWPPRSGRMQEFPEVDRGAWFTLPAARTKILEAQSPFLDRLVLSLRG